MTRPQNKTCLSYWFPKIMGLVPVPRTEIVYTNIDFWVIDDGKRPEGLDELLDCLKRSIGIIKSEGDTSDPVFLRTGYTSGKHRWKDTCFLADETKLEEHVVEIAYFSMLADFRGLDTSVWAVREFLKCPVMFECNAYRGMPVTPERRYFVDGPDVLYSIPYWPEDSLLEGSPNDPDWREKLSVIQAEFPQEAIEMSRKCGAACGGKWSVDVLLTNNGPVVTDMAEAEKSWGWKHVPGKYGTDFDEQEQKQ